MLSTAFHALSPAAGRFHIMTEFTKSPGWDWAVDYEDEDGELETMLVFGKVRIDDAVEEARRSFSANFFDLPDFVAPVVVGVRRV
jgi:hypothetical protein